jgi:hypothetical protein
LRKTERADRRLQDNGRTDSAGGGRNAPAPRGSGPATTGCAWPDAGEAETGGCRPGVGDGHAPNTVDREEGKTPATAVAQGV